MNRLVTTCLLTCNNLRVFTRVLGMLIQGRPDGQTKTRQAFDKLRIYRLVVTCQQVATSLFECTVNGSLQMVVKKICKIKTNLSEIRKALNLPPASSTEFRRCLCVAIFIMLESQSEKLWHQNYKLRHQNYKLWHQNFKLRHQNFKLRPHNYKLRPQNYKLCVQNLQV